MKTVTTGLELETQYTINGVYQFHISFEFGLTIYTWNSGEKKLYDLDECIALNIWDIKEAKKVSLENFKVKVNRLVKALRNELKFF